MRLLRTRIGYFYFLCVYALHPTFLLVRTIRGTPTTTHRPTSFLVLVPEAMGTAIVAIAAVSAIRKTSVKLEKYILILTVVICLSFVIGALQEYGYGVPVFRYVTQLIEIVSITAALLVFWRFLQVMTTNEEADGAGIRKLS